MGSFIETAKSNEVGDEQEHVKNHVHALVDVVDVVNGRHSLGAASTGHKRFCGWLSIDQKLIKVGAVMVEISGVGAGFQSGLN